MQMLGDLSLIFQGFPNWLVFMIPTQLQHYLSPLHPVVPIIPVVIPLAIDLSDFSDDLVIQRPTRENNGRGL